MPISSAKLVNNPCIAKYVLVLQSGGELRPVHSGYPRGVAVSQDPDGVAPPGEHCDPELAVEQEVLGTGMGSLTATLDILDIPTPPSPTPTYSTPSLTHLLSNKKF